MQIAADALYGIHTALLESFGYDRCAQIAKLAQSFGKTIRQIVLEQKLISETEFDAFISPEAVGRLGHTKSELKKQ